MDSDEIFNEEISVVPNINKTTRDALGKQFRIPVSSFRDHPYLRQSIDL